MTKARSSIDASSSIDAVQQEIIDSFEYADANVSVHKTGYFNHTYAPDLVLKWDGQKDERHVFLRASDNENYLREDIELLRDKDPIFVPLHGLVEHPILNDEQPIARGHMQALRDTSVSARALVTQPESIRVLGESARSEPISSLSARAVLQGGAGIFTPGFADSYNKTVAAGFKGALLGEEQLASEALRLSLEFLDTRRMSQLTELFQAAWIGGGQSFAAFPGLGLASGSLEPDALLLLLETVRVDDEDFWQRLARNLEMKHFTGLTIAAQNVGFQQLMRAAAPRLRAKAARTVEVEPSATTRQTIWALNDGVLSLALGRLRLDFVARSVDDFASEGYEASPSVRSFMMRAKAADLNILRVVLSDGDRRLEYVSENRTSVSSDDRISTLAENFRDAVVVRAVVAADGRDLSVNLEASTGSGHTRSTFYVSTLAQALIPLVLDMNEFEEQELLTVFASGEE